MTNEQYRQIIKASKDFVLKEAKKNGWLWFYNLHQREVARCAKNLLKLYQADKKIVLIAAWLHDISKNLVKHSRYSHKLDKEHHIASADFARQFLVKFNLDDKDTKTVVNCIIRHRNKPPYQVVTIEDKVLCVADTLSHFTSLFYFTYFKFHPEKSIDEMVRANLSKLKRDWDDLSLLPRARVLVKDQYKFLLSMHQSYKK